MNSSFSSRSGRGTATSSDERRGLPSSLRLYTYTDIAPSRTTTPGPSTTVSPPRPIVVRCTNGRCAMSSWFSIDRL